MVRPPTPRRERRARCSGDWHSQWTMLRVDRSVSPLAPSRFPERRSGGPSNDPPGAPSVPAPGAHASGELPAQNQADLAERLPGLGEDPDAACPVAHVVGRVVFGNELDLGELLVGGE
jgi:hypothetical protein